MSLNSTKGRVSSKALGTDHFLLRSVMDVKKEESKSVMESRWNWKGIVCMSVFLNHSTYICIWKLEFGRFSMKIRNFFRNLKSSIPKSIFLLLELSSKVDGNIRITRVEELENIPLILSVSLYPRVSKIYDLLRSFISRSAVLCCRRKCTVNTFPLIKHTWP